MRFLFECVGRWSVTSRDPPAAVAAAAAAETRLLVSKAPPPPRRRKRSINATSEWKPTLFAISEDNAIVVAPAKVDRRNNSRLPVDFKRCGPTSNNNKVNATRVNNPDLSRDPGPIIIPSAFAAAPFMF